MIAAMPSVGDIRINTRTSTGTSVTIPAGRIFCGEIAISGSVSVAGTATPRVTLNGGGTGVEPAAATIVHQVVVSGLLSIVGNNSERIEVIIRAGDADATLDFNTGGAGSASCTISGFFL